MAAEEARRVFEGERDISVLRELAMHVYGQLSQYADLSTPKGMVPLYQSELRGLAFMFLAISEALDPRGATKIALKVSQRPGRPRLPLQEQLRRLEAVSIVEEHLRAGAKNQSEAIKGAIEKMHHRGKGDGLSVRKLQRALQQTRKVGR
jgi:hypothetical protein